MSNNSVTSVKVGPSYLPLFVPFKKMLYGPFMLHQGHFFSKLMHFFRILSIIFVVFKPNLKVMNVFHRISLYIFFSFFAAVFTLDAQEYISENMILTAVTAIEEKKYSEAEAVLAMILAADPDNDAACYYMGTIAIARNDASKAEQYLKKAVEADPENFWYRYRLARIYELTSRPELTIDIYEELLKDFPKKSDLYFSLVELYAMNGQQEKSLETLKKIETEFGMTESIAMFRFNLLQQMGRQEEAMQSLWEYNEKYSSPYVLTALADYEMSVYNDSTAIGFYDEALELASDYPPALIGKAEALRITRKYDEYFEVLNRFISLSDAPAAGKSDYLLAVVRRMDPQFVRSFLSRLDEVIEKTREVHPSDSTVLQLAGVYYYSTDRKQKAGEAFRLNAETFPKSISASASYIEYLMYAEQWEELSQEGRKAFGRFPSETAFLEMASVGDYNLKEFDKVLEICDKVIEVAPKDSSKTLRAWSTKGDVYYQKGERKKAYKAYDKALKINPDYVYVLNNYAYYLSMEGKRLKKAYAMSKKTVEAEPDNATYLDTFGWILYLQGKALEAKPFFKRAMLYGGKESPVIMDHYAEVLYALGEHDLAFVYWDMAKRKNNGEIPDLEERIKARKNTK